MTDKLIFSGYIPFDKSWMIRLGFLDMINGYNDIITFLNHQTNLSNDLLALKDAVLIWKKNEPINVGESATLYRLLKFASWKLKFNKEFVVEGTLKHRKINDNPNIINLSQKELLKLDNNTSQWATASVLLGNVERIFNPPYKLQVTYNAIEHWKHQRRKKETWLPRYDETILNQAKTYQRLFRGEKPKFNPPQAEDFCFAYTFGFLSLKEGQKKWPSLVSHESNRIKEIKEMLEKAKQGKDIDSKDHRIIQSIAMWGKINNKKVKILYPDSVNKSWFQFWNFLNG